MKMRNKVHPFISSSSSSSSSSSPNKDPFPVLNLLPAAILTLISVLSLEDRQVLAYMITRSLKSSNPSKNHKPSKKQSLINDSHGRQSPALFDCDCFHCYTSFWFRWDSSPNRELIHHAIEAFEEHLTNSEQFNKFSAPKNRKKEKMGRRKNERGVTADSTAGSRVLEFPPQLKNQESVDDLVTPPETELGTADVVAAVEDSSRGAEPEDDLATAAPVVVVRNHKGLARKVLPDVMGIFSSRLWSLWSPNV